MYCTGLDCTYCELLDRHNRHDPQLTAVTVCKCKQGYADAGLDVCLPSSALLGVLLDMCWVACGSTSTSLA